ncbi:hypothetical protein Tco_0961698 [Tanacetum coccineum]
MRKDYGTKRGIHFISTSSSSAFDHHSSSHHVDEDVNDNEEGISRASTTSPIPSERTKVNREGRLELVEGKEEVSYLENG